MVETAMETRLMTVPAVVAVVAMAVVAAVAVVVQILIQAGPEAAAVAKIRPVVAEAELETMQLAGMVVTLEARAAPAPLSEVQWVRELTQAVVAVVEQIARPRLDRAAVAAAVCMVQQR